MAEFPDIPAGYGVPLVNLATDLLPAPTMDALAGVYVSVRNFDGTPVTADKFVVLTLSPDGTEVDDIAVYDSLDEVG
jgi:hypothetical protein